MTFMGVKLGVMVCAGVPACSGLQREWAPTYSYRLSLQLSKIGFAPGSHITRILAPTIIRYHRPWRAFDRPIYGPIGYDAVENTKHILATKRNSLTVLTYAYQYIVEHDEDGQDESGRVSGLCQIQLSSGQADIDSDPSIMPRTDSCG